MEKERDSSYETHGTDESTQHGRREFLRIIGLAALGNLIGCATFEHKVPWPKAHPEYLSTPAKDIVFLREGVSFHCTDKPILQEVDEDRRVTLPYETAQMAADVLQQQIAIFFSTLHAFSDRTGIKDIFWYQSITQRDGMRVGGRGGPGCLILIPMLSSSSVIHEVAHATAHFYGTEDVFSALNNSNPYPYRHKEPEYVGEEPDPGYISTRAQKNVMEDVAETAEELFSRSNFSPDDQILCGKIEAAKIFLGQILGYRVDDNILAVLHAQISHRDPVWNYDRFLEKKDTKALGRAELLYPHIHTLYLRGVAACGFPETPSCLWNSEAFYFRNALHWLSYEERSRLLDFMWRVELEGKMKWGDTFLQAL